MSKHKPLRIIHNIYNLKTGFLHSLTINDEESIRVGYNTVARHGIYAATTEAYKELPEVFVVTSLDVTVKTALYKKRIFNKVPDKRHISKYAEVK